MPGKIQNTKELGVFLRQARKNQKLTQATLSGVMNAGNRLLGEIESGKPTAQVGRVLEVIQLLGYELVLVKRGETLG
ncbi:XRE family transcriptional regulator [mine drainage metagenome]|uniref:XRE family transcriptional regulator n=1 Tax=mine drainage metagenome TaxID=410659 RepID=T0ZNK4_9ZZZZ